MPLPGNQGVHCLGFLCLIRTLVCWGAQHPRITRALLVKTQENGSLEAQQYVHCYPIGQAEATVSFNSIDSISEREHKVKIFDFTDAPAKPRSGALNWGQLSPPRGHVTMSGDMSVCHNWEVLLASSR